MQLYIKISHVHKLKKFSVTMSVIHNVILRFNTIFEKKKITMEILLKQKKRICKFVWKRDPEYTRKI